MKNLIYALLVVAVLAPVSKAQFEGEVREIKMDTLRVGDVPPTKIGVADMLYIGTSYITSRDSLLMNYVTATVRFDIDFYAEWELVMIDSFYLKIYEIDEIDVFGWKRLGAQYILRLEAEFPGTQMMRVRWQLWETDSNEQFAKGVVERTRTDWRKLGHDISNEIARTLTGDQGIFLTKIAYCKEIGSAKEIFVSDYDGANERQLTNTGTINISPSFAPDMEWVYFISYMDGDPSLYVVNVNRGQPQQVAKFPGMIAAPAVSPDGNKIACVLTKDGNSEIYVLDLQGNIIKRLTRHWAIDTSPTWSPDSRSIAFASDRTGSPQVYIMDSDGLNVHRVTYQGSYNDSPIWSAHGDRITFVSRTRRGRFDLASIDTSGANYRILTEVGQNENPHFSPDGKHIIFSSTRLGPRDIFTMDMTGRNQRRLTQSGGCSNPDWGPMPVEYREE
ncbi:MAG TPA: Tol-Pal system beta propeller repeat protein TolB [candidate division Zixibacteria bacterium]|nr:Tol-Pal system beta propeller repeat protein TolB [candidate division Zixibacteria bacterium]